MLEGVEVNVRAQLKKRESRKTGNTGYRRQRKQKQKHNTICVTHHYTQINTNNTNKAPVLIQKTGGNDEPNIASMQKFK